MTRGEPAGVSRQPSVTFSLNNDHERSIHRPRCSSRTGSVAEEHSSSQFNPATLDAVSIHSRRETSLRRSYSNLEDARDPYGQLVVYDPHLNSHAMMPPPVPLWLPTMSPPPPPPMWYPTIAPPPDAKACRKMFKEMMKHEQKQFQAKSKPRSACAEYCCGSVASLLWIIIGIIIGAIVLALILAFFVV